MIMGRLYETILIAKPDFDQEGFEKLHTRLLKTIGDEGGLELKLVDWGRRRLAYPIDGHRKGNYFYLGYIASPACLKEIHRQLRLSQEIIRFQSITLSKSKPLGHFDIEKEREKVVGLTPDPQDEEEFGRRERGPRGDRGGRGDRGDRGDRRRDDSQGEKSAEVMA